MSRGSKVSSQIWIMMYATTHKHTPPLRVVVVPFRCSNESLAVPIPCMLQSLRRYQITRPGRSLSTRRPPSLLSAALPSTLLRHINRSGRRGGDPAGDGECTYVEERLDDERRDRVVAVLTCGRFEHPSSTCLCRCQYCLCGFLMAGEAAHLLSVSLRANECPHW